MNKIVSEDIDIIRGLAAIGVVVGHTLNGFVSVPLLDGGFWVWIFFVLSGYLQGHSFFSGRYGQDAGGIKGYWINRGLRILPLFWLALALGFSIRFAYEGRMFDGQMLRQFLALTNNTTLVGPLWSITAEIHLYLLVPFIVWLMSRYRSSLLTVLFLLGGFCLIIYPGIQFSDVNQPRSVWGNLLLFSIGMFAAQHAQKPEPVKAWIKMAIIVAAVGTALYTSKMSSAYFYGGGGMLIAAIIGLTTVIFQEERGLLHAVCSPLRFVGRYCYGFYVYAALMGVYSEVVLKQSTGWHAFSTNLAGGILLAFVSYHTYEKLFLRLKSKRVKETEVAVAPVKVGRAV